MRASEVVQRIRALSKKTDPQKVALDVSDIISDAIRLLQREFSDHHALVHLELTPTAPQVIGDRIQLQQVIINLVMNGLEAMADIIEASAQDRDPFEPNRTRPGAGRNSRRRTRR